MKTTTSWGFVLLAVIAMGCTNAPGPTLARPNAQQVKTQVRDALGGVTVAATATFDAPVIDANTTTAPSVGTGNFTVAPSTTGGNTSIGVIDNSSRPPLYYVMVGDLMGSNPTAFLSIISDVPFTTGTHPIDNVHSFAGLFDPYTGNPTHLATSGSVTFTQVGGVGGRWVGSFSGDLEEVQAAPGCQSTADCATGEVCSNGTCVRAPPPQCTSNSQCATGQVCQGGVCVPSTPACVQDSDCAAGQICAGGQCQTFSPPQCQADSDCSRGEVCQANVCVPAAPQCTSNAQCPSGWACQSGQCVPPTSQCTSNAQCPSGWQCVRGTCSPGTTAPACEGQQGDGSLSGSTSAVASCAAIPAGSVSITQGVAVIDDELRLVIFDPSAGDEGAMLELAVCPGAPGTLSLGNGLVSASHIKDVQLADLRLYAERRASAATLTLTRVTPTLAGTFSLTLAAGGNVNGSFTMY